MADDPGWPDDAVEVGRIVGAWGVKGAFRVQPHASEPGALTSARRWFLRPPHGTPAARTAALPRVLNITRSREHGDGVVAQAVESPDRNAAETLKGAAVFVPRAAFPAAGDGEYYWVDLIGMAVLNREGQHLGVVTDLIPTGPHSVLRLQRQDAAPGAAAEESERLIPFVDAYVDDVDQARRVITVDWGLDF